MKRIFTILSLVLFTFNIYAQVPHLLSYQAIVRDADNNLITNLAVGMQISILYGNAETGTVVYSEVLTPTTNDNGMVSVEIGGEAGFTSIDWSDGPYFIKTEIDPGGNTNYTITGVSQLLTVPYALHAKTAETITTPIDGSETIIISGTDVIVNGTGTADSPYEIGVTPGAEIGEIRYWDGSNWVAVAPGESGTRLTFCNGVPTWGPCPGLATLNIIYVSEVTQASAKIGVHIISDGGNEIAERGVVYDIYPNPTTDDSKVSFGTGLGFFEAEISGLTGGLMYYVRAYAITDEGIAYSDPEAFVAVELEFGSVIDSQGNEYKTVVIGNQEWFAENLRTTQYNNSVPIPNIRGNSEWSALESGAYAVYNHDNIYMSAYGVMYNWYAVVDSRGICPAGWDVATDAQWTTLFDYVANSAEFAGATVGKALKSCRQINSPLGIECAVTDHPRWNSHTNVFGTDNYGFGGLPGGNRSADGAFYSLGSDAFWWSSTESDETTAWRRVMHLSQDVLNRSAVNKKQGFYVRCVRPAP